MIYLSCYYIGPCTDKRCQNVSSLNVNICLMTCIDNIGADDRIISICVSVTMITTKLILRDDDTIMYACPLCIHTQVLKACRNHVLHVCYIGLCGHICS